MAKTIENLFVYLHYFIDLAVIVLFIVSLSQKRYKRDLLAIALYCFFDLLLNVLSLYVPRRPILIGNAIFTFLEYSFFVYFLWVNIKNRLLKRLIIAISIVYFIFITIHNIISDFQSIDSVPIGVETIIILILSFYYLYEQMNDSNTLFIYNQYQFWVIVGLSLYLAGSFFLFIFASQMDRNMLDKYWFLTNIFYVLMNVMFGIAFFINGKKPNKISNNLYPYPN